MNVCTHTHTRARARRADFDIHSAARALASDYYTESDAIPKRIPDRVGGPVKLVTIYMLEIGERLWLSCFDARLFYFSLAFLRVCCVSSEIVLGDVGVVVVVVVRRCRKIGAGVHSFSARNWLQISHTYARTLTRDIY